jgi:hypothetical protein
MIILNFLKLLLILTFLAASTFLMLKFKKIFLDVSFEKYPTFKIQNFYLL